MMKGLDQHYGTDASLDTRHGAADQRVAGSPCRHLQARARHLQDRITQSAWFERKHRDIEPAVWKRASIGSRANCMACPPLGRPG